VIGKVNVVEQSYVDIIGKKFNRWTVIGEAKLVNEHIKFLCVCECGKTKYVDKHSLIKGKTVSCGMMGRNLKLLETYTKISEVIGG
jgi:Zn finger protein HypA/HybF involved in hydrogenase expression